MPLDQLIPHDKNANKHPKKQIEMLAKILKYQGWRHPIVVSNLSGKIVAGHGRLEAARINQWLEAPVDFQDFDDVHQEIAFLYSDNKIQELAEHDDELLKQTAIDMDFKGVGFDLDLLGIPDLDLSAPDPAKELIEDDVPEIDKSQVRTKLGDIIELGPHRLMCGDSTDRGVVELLMNGEKADMVFTDPPYGINEDGDRSGRGGITQANNLKSFVDDSIEYAVKAFELCKDIRIQYWFGANYYCHHLPQTNNWLVWDKRLEEKQTNNNSDCEMAWVKSEANSIRIFRHLWKGLIKGSEHGQRRVHPTQKPIALPEWVINKHNASSVLDLFGGSGSTLIACEKTNRKCFMMELDPHYCDVIISRWCKYTNQTEVKVNGKSIKWVIP